MNLSEYEFISFDLETTGLNAAFNQIVEIGAVRFKLDDTELDRLQLLVNPECQIPAEVTRIHGITNKMVKGAPVIKDALSQFFEFIDSDNTILLAHNASFDVGFLSQSATKTDIRIPDNMVIDNLMLARCKVQKIVSHRLEVLARHFGIAESTEHRALSDSIVLKSVFLNILKNETEIQALDDLLKYARPMKIESVNVEPASIPEKWIPFHEMINKSQAVMIYYEGANGYANRRQITPIRFVKNKNQLYIHARCHIDEREKHFRLDRILEVWWE